MVFSLPNIETHTKIETDTDIDKFIQNPVICISVSLQYVHLYTTLYKPFLSVSVLGSVNTPLAVLVVGYRWGRLH